jgi:outer membrane receptor protein involved in Fe transport
MQWRSVYRVALLASVGLVSSTVAVAQPTTAQSEAAVDYDIPAQDLGDTLRVIARLSGHDILFVSDAVRGLKAPPVKGRYNLDDALRRALTGSGLEVDYRAGAAVIRQRGQTADHEPAAASNPTITVTGTRIRGVGSASPVTVATRQQLEQAGITDLAEFTRMLPQNYAGGQNRGIAGGGEQGGQQNLNNSATLNLRGLGPDATLTLLNGHRLSYDSINQGIDISAIPLAAIERIEVVSDGASALYGSDAVAGVANIILRRDYEGIETTARFGGATSGGDLEQDYSLVGGHRWGTGGFMVALDRSSATALYAGQRGFTRTVDPSLTLTDGNGQISGVFSAHQLLAPGLTLEFDGNAMNRHSLLQNPFLPTADVRVSGLVSRPHVLSYALTPTLRADLGSWDASVSVTDSDSRTLLDTRYYSNSLLTHSHILLDDTLKGAEATAEGPLFALPGGDARLAIGGGARAISLHDRYVFFNSGQHLTTKNFTERRSVQFAYGELSLPIVGPDLRVPLIKRLTLSAALRHEHWNQIAAITTPKLGLIYQPVSDVTVRATWGKSFKIPTLIQVSQVGEGDLIPGFIFDPPPQPAGSTVLYLSGSAPGLKPEQATTWSATVEVTPRIVPGLDVRATYFDIDYRGRIVSPFISVVSALYNPLYSDFIVYNPTAAQVNGLLATLPGGLVNETGAPFDPSSVGAIVDSRIRNSERQQIRGVDFNADYRRDLGAAGKLLLTAAASYLESNQQAAAGQPIFELAGTVFHPPHWHGRAGAVWDTRGTELSAFVDYIGPRQENRFATSEKIASFVTLDLNAIIRTGSKHGPLRNIELMLSALNVLNQKPHFIRNSLTNAAPYDSTNESPVGRFLRASIRKVW